jgi:excisionase family DNA binding protein
MNASAAFLSPRELSQRWSFHPESVRRMLREGRLPVTKMGKRLRVAVADVLAYEEQNRMQRPLAA